MFIYEKNKLNKETGVVEQSLNVTFEGNKPVETPDVVITKDGVTGIKSDSNAYIENITKFYTGEGRFNAEDSSYKGITCDYSLVGSHFTSFSIDGEIVITQDNNKNYIIAKECDYVGLNIEPTTTHNQICFTLLSDSTNPFYATEMTTIDADLTNGGELIINMRTGETSFGDITTYIDSSYLNHASTIIISVNMRT